MDTDSYENHDLEPLSEIYSESSMINKLDENFVSYKYKQISTNKSALPNLLISLKKLGNVSKETDIRDFKKIFNNELPAFPIVWLSGVSDLNCFIQLLHVTYELIEIPTSIKWKVTAALFVDETGCKFKPEGFRGLKKASKNAEKLKKSVLLLK